MRHKALSVCLVVLMLVNLMLTFSSAIAQEEYDVFIYLPLIIKSESPPPDCNAYEPNDAPGQANWVQDGETQVQCIIPKIDTDWVKFSASAESEVVLEAADEGGDLEMRVYNSNLDEIDYSYSGSSWPARFSRRCGLGEDPLPAGTYYARFEHWLNSNEIPSYDITLKIDACPGPPAILTNHSSYVDTWGWDLHVVGEVQNSGEIGLSGVDVIANLFNGSDQLIDTDTDDVELSVLPPSDKACFHLYLSEYSGWSYYTFETPIYSSISDNYLQNMTVHGDHGTYDPSDGSYSILGFVRNDNDFRVESVQPIGTLYDASGTVVGCDYTYVNSSDLDPDQSSSFEMRFSGYYRDYSDVASYRVQVDGYVQ